MATQEEDENKSNTHSHTTTTLYTKCTYQYALAEKPKTNYLKIRSHTPLTNWPVKVACKKAFVHVPQFSMGECIRVEFHHETDQIEPKNDLEHRLKA